MAKRLGMCKPVKQYMENNDYMITRHTATHWHIVDCIDSSIFVIYRIKRGYEYIYRIYKNGGKPFYRRDLMSFFRRRA